jgi:hypothetical protein
MAMECLRGPINISFSGMTSLSVERPLQTFGSSGRFAMVTLPILTRSRPLATG